MHLTGQQLAFRRSPRQAFSQEFFDCPLVLGERPREVMGSIVFQAVVEVVALGRTERGFE
jgi:hypothetical protein